MTRAREAMMRETVVRQAMSWERTPYRQWGATRGVAVDCAMLLVRAYVDAGIFEEFDPRPYPPEWMTHRDDERYLEWMHGIANEVETPAPGDIVLFRFQRCFSHSGLMVSKERLIHAYAPWGICCFGNLTDRILAEFHKDMPRPRKFFSVFDRLRALGR